MILKERTLEKLRKLINEETEYRTGPVLIKFFNNLGFRDKYEDFPSRWKYTDERLKLINGKPELDKCIKNVFDPQNFIWNISKLDSHIEDFNQFIAFDKWQVMRENTEINFRKIEKITLHDKNSVTTKDETREDEFLSKEFDISLSKTGLDGTIIDVLNSRLEEIKNCFAAKAPLSVIFLSGSTLEWILLGTALKFPKDFNQAPSAPKDKEGKIKQLPDWTLNQLINVAFEINLIKEDVKKFSHVLRDFRNYIHPYQQVGSNFHPDEHTARICWQVLRAAIFQLSIK